MQTNDRRNPRSTNQARRPLASPQSFYLSLSSFHFPAISVVLNLSCILVCFGRSIRSRQDSEEALTIFFCLGTLPFDISTFVAEQEIDAVGRLFGGDGRDARNREQGMLSTRV